MVHQQTDKSASSRKPCRLCGNCGVNPLDTQIGKGDLVKIIRDPRNQWQGIETAQIEFISREFITLGGLEGRISGCEFQKICGSCGQPVAPIISL